MLEFDGLRFFTVREVTKQVGISEGYVRKLIRQGLLGGRRLGKRWYVSLPELRAFVERGTDWRPGPFERGLEKLRSELERGLGT